MKNRLPIPSSALVVILFAAAVVMPRWLDARAMAMERMGPAGQDVTCCSLSGADSESGISPTLAEVDTRDESQDPNPPAPHPCDCGCCANLPPSPAMLVLHLTPPSIDFDSPPFLLPLADARPERVWLGVPLQPPIA